MKIKRRVQKGTKELIEDAKLVKKRGTTVLVELKNGDIIKRKHKDVVEW